MAKLQNSVMIRKLAIWFQRNNLEGLVTTAVNYDQRFYGPSSHSYHAILPQEPSYTPKSHNLILLA